MNEMVERVAKAIFNAENGIDGDQIGDMLYEDFRIVGEKDEAIARTMDVCRLAAAAAIEAMREPTEAMVGAAWAEATVRASDAGYAWEAMIDAALGRAQDETARKETG